ncbi:MAG: hypothetical protein ACYDCD_14675 [Candidatus Acidiferrales bacterium]
MLDAPKVLAGIPAGLRDPLFQSYQEIVTNFAEHRWEPSELNGGKFCEVVYTIVNGVIAGSFPPKPSKPGDMVLACRNLEGTPAQASRVGDRSLRILIPRVLPTLYEIRNNRGVGHVGGDVDPNFMDATAVYAMASWILAELVRIFHRISTKDAQETVDALVERKIGLVWEVEEIKRVLDPNMNKDDQTLVLLYSKPAWAREKDLVTWVEYSNATMFRRNILRVLHKARLIEYDARQHRARISPLGSKHVEQQIIKTRTP